MNPKGIALIHGAGLGSFIWNGMVDKLNLPAIALDFPNRNKGDEINKQLRLNDYSNKIIHTLDRWDTEKLIIVAHSIGGCVGLKVAEHFGSRVIGFVGVGAAIPLNGNSFVSCLPFPQNLVMPLVLKLAGTKAPEKAIENGLCSDLSDEQKKLVHLNQGFCLSKNVMRGFRTQNGCM
jgi:pimeloyl-ACP methyl ester carboxylesterase